MDTSRKDANHEHGGAAVGSFVDLPPGAEPPIRVFVNGVEREEGRDFELVEGGVAFSAPIWKEQKLSRWRFAGLMLVGQYQRHEVVDLEYTLQGERHFGSDLPVRPR